MFPILQIGSIAIQTPGLILLLGLWLGLELAERQAVQADFAPNKLFNTALAAIGAGLIGGRLVFAAMNPQVFYQNPLNLFSLSLQMIDITGGLAFAAAAGLAYGSRVGLPLWPAADCLTSLLAVLQVSLGLANFASGDGYGLPTDLPWAIYLWGANRHPSQLYETGAALIAAFFTWPTVLKIWLRISTQPGARFWMFCTFSSVSWLFLEAFRASGSLLWQQYRLVQVLAWCVLALSLWQIARKTSPATATQ